MLIVKFYLVKKISLSLIFNKNWMFGQVSCGCHCLRKINRTNCNIDIDIYFKINIKVRDQNQNIVYTFVV